MTEPTQPGAGKNQDDETRVFPGAGETTASSGEDAGTEVLPTTGDTSPSTTEDAGATDEAGIDETRTLGTPDFDGNPYAGDTYRGEPPASYYAPQNTAGADGADGSAGSAYPGYQSHQGYRDAPGDPAGQADRSGQGGYAVPGYGAAQGYPEQGHPGQGYQQNYQAPGYQDPGQGYQVPGYGAAPGYGVAPGYPGYGVAPGYQGYGVAPGYQGYVSPKSKAVGAVLAFFLGGFGAHNFYFGQKGRAIAQLVITVGSWIMLIAGVSCITAGVDATSYYNSYGYRSYADDDGLVATGIILIVVAGLIMTAEAIWILVEFIMILVGSRGYDRDEQGLPIR